MASMWKKAMTYLGLGDDEDYADYELEAEVEPRRQPPPERRPVREPSRPPVGGPRERSREPRGEGVEPVNRGAVRQLGPDPRASQTGVGAVTTRSGQGGQRGAVVRPLPIPVTAKPHVVQPRSFNAAQEVADTFKGNAPVIMNLQEVDRELSRRLIDFASGLCYGLGGGMEKVANSVYLLTPSDVEVSAEDKRRFQ
jgi:cell division inhibitor SepF